MHEKANVDKRYHTTAKSTFLSIRSHDDQVNYCGKNQFRWLALLFLLPAVPLAFLGYGTDGDIYLELAAGISLYRFQQTFAFVVAEGVDRNTCALGHLSGC